MAITVEEALKELRETFPRWRCQLSFFTLTRKAVRCYLLIERGPRQGGSVGLVGADVEEVLLKARTWHAAQKEQQK